MRKPKIRVITAHFIVVSLTAIYNAYADIRQNSESHLLCKLRCVIEDLIKDCSKILGNFKCLMIEVKISFMKS
jgi:hypothetical protein